MANVIRHACVVAAVVTMFHSAAGAVALSSEAAKCQKTVATQGRVFFKKRFGALQKCQDAIIKGTLASGTDCTLDAKAAAKILNATTKFNDKVVDKCSNDTVTSLDFGGQCLGVTTTAGLTSCLLQEHVAGVDDLLATAYPATDPSGRECAGGASKGNACTDDIDCTGSVCLPTKDQGKCYKTFAKTLVKIVNKRQAIVQKCKKLIAKDKLAADTDCVAESQDKINKLNTKSIEKVQAKCPDAIAATELFGASCAGAGDASSVAACGSCSADSSADDLIVVQHGSGSIGGTASAAQITDTADCVDGPLSRCAVSDYLMSNAKIRVVIQDIERNYLGGIGQFGGQIIDADLVRTVGADRDNFEELAVSLNIESTAHYTSLSIINDGSNGGPAIIRATGVDDLLDLLNPSSVVADFGFALPAAANDFDIPVTVHTDYILEPGASFVRIETTVQNTDVSPINIFLGEFMNGSGQLEIFQSGYGFGEALATSPCTSGNVECNRMANMVAYTGQLEADGVSYGYVTETDGTSAFTTSGVTVPLLGTDVVSALIGFASANFTLAANGSPGDSVTITRLFIVGDGSVSDLIDTRNAAQCVPFGTISGTIDVGGSPISGADVAVLGVVADGPGGAGIHGPLARNVVSHTRTDAAGNYSLTLPPGDYEVAAHRDGGPFEGGGSNPIYHPATVTAFNTVTQDITMPDTGTLRVTVTDESLSPIAARIAVVGFDPSADPVGTQGIIVIFNRTTVFGDRQEDGYPFGIALNAYADDSGDTGDLALEPGTYRVYVSHGTEYSIDFKDVTIVAGATETFAARVEHVIDTTGFISGDFHVHSIDSPDSAIARTDRVIAMLGEGVDFFASTDHGFRADFGPTISALGVDALISTAVGQEITTFDYGHFNAWPLDFDPLLPNGGFIDHGGAAPDGADYPSAGNYSETPDDIITLAHADYSGGTNTVQINHVHSHFGVDGGSGLAIDTGLTPPASGVPAAARRLDPGITNYFTGGMDALEIWIGESLGQVEDNLLGQNAGDWLNLINQGIISTGVASSDTHRRFITQSGFPRSMVASTEGDVGDIDEGDVSEAVNDGRVVGTNGPLIRVTAHAVSTDESGGIELGRCQGVVSCTNTTTCPPCGDDSDCSVGETCDELPTLITTTDGAVDITVEVQSPTWAPFDRIEFFINTTTGQSTNTGVQTGAGTISVNRYELIPDVVQTAGVDFTVSVVGVPGTTASRLETSTTLSLTSLSVDQSIVVMVSGTDGVSAPLFPVVPNSIDESANLTLADLIDGNVGEDGIAARAFTNPVFVNADGVGGWQAPGVSFVVLP